MLQSNDTIFEHNEFDSRAEQVLVQFIVILLGFALFASSEIIVIENDSSDIKRHDKTAEKININKANQ